MSCLVSCIMPTRDRRSFVPHAIKYFLRQDYQSRELIVVDDGDDSVEDLIPNDPRLKYIRLTNRTTLGAKRNVACAKARGQVILHWDDDDWMAPWRISYQVGRLLRNQSDVCGLNQTLYFDVVKGQAWEHIYPQSIRHPWVTGGTLCYTKKFWDRNQFLNISLGEDTKFQWSDCSKRVLTLPNPKFYVALIHPGNTSPKRVSDHWHRYPMDKLKQLMEKDWEYYHSLNDGDRNPMVKRKQIESGGRNGDMPLVSVVFPTYNRREFFDQALRYYHRQDYPNKELIIIDDGTESVKDLVSPHPKIRYVRYEKKYSIGTKRNIGCSLAKGKVIIFWDDDDWYAPNRITYQVAPILQDNTDISALGKSIFFAWDSHQFWTCSTNLFQQMFAFGVTGGTLAFKKQIWLDGGRFPDSSLAEEATFLREVVSRGARLEKLVNEGVFFYVRHKSNSWQFDLGHYLGQRSWSKVPPPRFIPKHDLQYYGITT